MTLIGFFIFCLFVVKIAFGDTWNYDYSDTHYGPYYWSDLYGTCGGDEQSPINIDAYIPSDGFSTFSDQLNEYGIDKNGSQTFLNQWDWNGEFLHHFQVTNNGHSIQLSPIDAQGNSLSGKSEAIARLTNIFGSLDDSPSQFCLDSLHFHWGEHGTEGSEHTQYNKQYPAEVHFVHYSCDFNDLSSAVDAHLDKTDSHVLAVVAFLFEIVCVSFFICLLCLCVLSLSMFCYC